MARVKIIHVTLSLNIGGLENLVLKLLSKIDREKYIPHVCTMTANSDLVDEFLANDVCVHVLEKREGIDWSLSFRLRDLFRQLGVDIVHTHNIAPYLYATIGAKMAGVPVVIHTEHSNLFSHQKRLMSAERVFSKVTDAIISDSEKVTAQLISGQKIDPNKVKTIINGIDTDSFAESARINLSAKIGIPEEHKVVGIVARLVPVKNHKMLLESFSLIKQKLKRVNLVIVGDGPLRGELESYAKTLGIAEYVTFLGNRRDVPELMSAFNLFALSSLDEGLSLTLLEAMSSGLPIVATEVGGNPEVVVCGETGFIVPSQNPAAFAQACVKLLSDDNLALEMGRQGLERVRALYSIDKMTRSYEQVYERAQRIRNITN